MIFCEKHNLCASEMDIPIRECPECVVEERDLLRDACVRIFERSENMIANVPQCDTRYYQGHMCAAEKILREAGYDHRGHQR